MSSLWKDAAPLILASTSATRLQLLRSVNLPVEAVASNVDERSIEEELQRDQATPDTIALELARAKAVSVARRFPDRWVIAADQTLALGSRQFHKPASRDAAAEQLRSLSGQTHQLHSAMVCYRNNECRFQQVESASLTMRPFSSDFLRSYLELAGDAVMSSVGGYQVEGLGAHLFQRIEGDHSTILGLPLLPLLSFLRRAGLLED